MKKQIYTFVGLLIFLTISSVNAIYAQSGTIVRAHIPFDFSVKEKTIPAGDYVINRADDGGRVWFLYSYENRQSVVLLAMTVQGKDSFGKGKLTFRRYGEKYFLASIETSGNQIKLPKSREEKNLVKELKNNHLAKNNEENIKPEIVAIQLGM